jgi:hypothetical protein
VPPTAVGPPAGPRRLGPSTYEKRVIAANWVRSIVSLIIMIAVALGGWTLYKWYKVGPDQVLKQVQESKAVPNRPVRWTGNIEAVFVRYQDQMTPGRLALTDGFEPHAEGTWAEKDRTLLVKTPKGEFWAMGVTLKEAGKGKRVTVIGKVAGVIDSAVPIDPNGSPPEVYTQSASAQGKPRVYVLDSNVSGLKNY